jgi:pimeloyl-ACP methyl ester carboxylesterase
MSRQRDAVTAWRRQMTAITVDGLRTWVLDTGFGDPVVFLHGIPTQAYLWRDVARVVGRDFRAIAPDLLGFGFSDRSGSADISPAGQATFIERVLSELGVRTFVLVTHDFGALVGAEMLARDPTRVTHVVITNTSLWREDWLGGQISPLSLLKIRGLGEAAFRVARPFLVKRAFALYVATDARLTNATIEVYWHPFENGFAGTLLRLARSGDATLDETAFERWRAALRAFERPALVVWGDLDRTFRTDRGQRIAALLPRGDFELFEHSNHFIPEDRPEALGRLVSAFLHGRYRG